MAEPIEDRSTIHPGCHEWSVKLSNIANTLRSDDGMRVVLNNAAMAFVSYGRIIARNEFSLEEAHKIASVIVEEKK